MCPLWQSKIKKIPLTDQKSPSPKGKLFSRTTTVPRNVMKGTSMVTSFRRRLRASMTVEAALVLPLFLFFFWNLAGAIEMIRLHSNMELALWSIGNRLSVYGSALEQEGGILDRVKADSEIWGQMAGVAFSYTYVKQSIRDYLGDNYLNTSPVANGTEGLHFWDSRFFTGEDTFEIVVSYGVSPSIGIAGFRPFGMVNHYYGHVWNGYELPGSEETIIDTVYITETGTVYHENANCTHLRLSIQETTQEQALQARNSSGSRYRMCELCGGFSKDVGETGVKVWITEEGDRIHYRKDCSGLKRTVYTKDRQEAVNMGYRPCSRCSR